MEGLHCKCIFLNVMGLLNINYLWACPKLKSFPQGFENENVDINEMYLTNEFD